MSEARGPVALVLPTLGVGGTEAHVVALAGALVRAEGAAVVVALGSSGPLAAEARAAGARVHVLGLEGTTDARAVGRLVALLKDVRPSLVHAFLSGFDGVAAVAARLAAVPCVLGSRREIAGWMRTRHRIAQAMGTALVDGVVCCSEAVLRHVRESEPGPPAGLVAIPNGVDLGRFRVTEEHRAVARARLGLGPADRALVTVANFAAEKGHVHLLEAFARIAATEPGAVLLLAGNGPLRGSCEAQARALGLDPERVRFLGLERDVAGLLAAADLFVLPSLSEGMPNALLEAMAAGVAPVATRVGGIPEVVEHGTSGLLVAPRSAPELARACLQLLRDPALSTRMGEAARARAAAAFDLDSVLARHLRHYREVASA